MKIPTIAAAICVGLASVTGAAMARTITEPTITIGSMTPTPESPAIARKEAAAVLAQAQRDCPKEPGRDARKSCMASARTDYDHMMAKAGRAA